MTTPNYSPPYVAEGNCLYLLSESKRGQTKKKLCNFAPFVVEEVCKHDGMEPTTWATLSGIHESGRELPPVTIDATDISSFDWALKHWGLDCILSVGKSVKEHVRVAIQQTAKDAEKVTVYTITGWVEHGRHWHYLMPGDDELTVELKGKLKPYYMDRHYEDMDLTKAACLLTEPPAPDKIMLPLLGYTFLSVLIQFMKLAKCEPKFVLFLLGKTGCRKSTLAALVLSFFGEFSSTELPLSFRDTANHILSCTYNTKDALTCIDDFHPGSSQEQNRMTTTAQTIMRAYGDRTGRGRLKADCTAMEAQPPQGNAIITGEYAPDIGESGTARYIALEMKEEDVDLGLLSIYQREAATGAFNRCTYAFTEWIIEKYLSTPAKEEVFIKELNDRFVQYRTEFNDSHRCHGRLAEAVAQLQIGLDFFTEFLLDHGQLDPQRVDELKQRHRDVLYQQAAAQSKAITNDKPTHKFIRKLYALLDSEQAHLVDRKKISDLGCGVCLGYEDDQYLYLHSDLAFKVVRKFCEDQGESFAGTQKSLLKALAEEKLIEPGEHQNTRVLRLGERQKRVIYLRKDKAEAIRDALL